MTHKEMDNSRANLFLAECLFESIEDENYLNAKKMLVDYKADCNLIIPGREIAAIHYAAGMDNVSFAENVMKLMLKNGGDPNTKTTDGETPLHVAAIWNRELIIEMLLDHGGDFELRDNEGNTAISIAITEKHYNLIPIFQNYVFEDKMQKRIQRRNIEMSVQSPTVRQLATQTRRLEIPPNAASDGSPRCDRMLTPNKTNFNFDAVSPFLVNVTHRRRPVRAEVQNAKETSKLSRTISVDRNIMDGTFTVDEPKRPLEIAFVPSDDEDEDVFIVQENLFQLTELNLEKHLRSTPKQNRISLVNSWRNKVNKSRRRESIVPADTMELDSFILKHTSGSHLSTLSSSKVSTPISNSASNETVVPAAGNQNREEQMETGEEIAVVVQSVGSDSFVTAEAENAVVASNEQNGLLNVDSSSLTIRSPDANKVVFQLEEAYMHTDTENNIVFYEQKLLTNPALRKSIKSSNADESVVASDSCPETEYTIPLDYDTDDLRRELTQFGIAPGPITKSTKRLYMKRLIRYKRKPAEAFAPGRGLAKKKPNYSVELKKTLRPENVPAWQELISNYSYLERQMTEGFHLCPTKRFREGNLKTSFIYLLIDPRISENLPGESQLIPKNMLWQRFVPSIFYVGKGKCSRPYAHLYDAMKIYQDKDTNINVPEKYRDSLKLERITDIWQSGKGVICLPVFHNIVPVEAYTREAAIIDCIGIENLTNIKRGDYYGISKSWTLRQRRQLGVLLLYKAMHIFLAEGESQLRPDDIQHKK